MAQAGNGTGKNRRGAAGGLAAALLSVGLLLQVLAGSPRVVGSVERQLRHAYVRGARLVNDLRLAVELHSLTGKMRPNPAAAAGRGAETCSPG